MAHTTLKTSYTMTFNTTAASLTKHGAARAIDKHECHDLLQKAYDHNLVQFGENVREQVNFISTVAAAAVRR